MYNPSLNDIDIYLKEVQKAVKNNRFKIERNKNRQENISLFVRYVLDEQDAKDILLGLEATDFSEIRRNTHPGYEHELLYVFGKDVELMERTGEEIKMVSLYIKFNKLTNCFVIVVSFHEQIYPMKYCFK